MSKRPPTLKRSTVLMPKRKAWDTPSQDKRLTGRANQKARRALFQREPLCRECAKHGRVTVATIRDHVTALALGGREHPDNEQPLCGPCHDAKTKAEAAEGARRKGRGAGKSLEPHALDTAAPVKLLRVRINRVVN